MTSLKNEYDALKKSHDNVKEKIATLKGKKEVAEKELKKIDVELKVITKEKKPKEVLTFLEKEIEVRLELLRGDVTKLEREVEDFMDEDSGIVTENRGSSDEFDFKLEGLDED